jgi:hypothetical protein
VSSTPAADRHDLDEPSGGFGQALQALGDHLVEGQHRQGRAGCGGRAAVASHELFDEKRAAARFARHGARRSLRELVGCVEESEHEPVRLVHIERPHQDVARFHPFGPPLAHLLQEGARLRLVVAIRHHEQDRRRSGGTQQVEQQGGAVDVPPVRVVDEEHERLPRREPREQPAEGGERPATDSLRIVDGLTREPADHVDAPEDREEASQQPHVRGEVDGRGVLRDAEQVTAQRVDDRVDGLVRHGLPLVRPPSQDDRLAAVRETIEEVMDEGRLAHPGGAGDAHGQWSTRPCGVERLAQRRELTFAPHESVSPNDVPELRWRRGAARDPQPTEDLRALGAHRWIAVEERPTERIEIGRHPVDALGR